jgi:cysteine desulfurase / selenocysteine lyase
MSALNGAGTLSEVREREFPIVKEVTYLNGASQGPWPTRTVQAVQEVAAVCQLPHTARAAEQPPYEQIARERLARLMGADAGDIAFTSNTTHGMNIAVQGIAWREGDNIVVPQREFPALSYTMYNLKERGVDVRFIPYAGAGPSVDELMAHVDSRTRAVACSAIMWDTGYRADLESLGRRCADAGCLLIVDGIQWVGARPLDVKALRVSTFATHGYKWLLSGFGIAALYVAPEAVDRIAPTFVGISSVASGGDGFEGHLNWKPGAARYQAGGGNRIGWAALATSLGLIEDVGIAAIGERNSGLAEYLYAGLTRKESVEIVSSPDPAHRAQIIVFTLGSKERDAAMAKQLEDQGIIVALRPLGMRASPNFYNTEEEIDRLLTALPN